MLVELLRDHVYWRRNIHPEDRPQIPAMAQYRPEYYRLVARMKSELHGLSARLKRSVPLYTPRYIGHMSSDLLPPGLIAQLVTTLYNPNNVTEETAPATLPLELEVGRQLAAIFGLNVSPGSEPCAWGHVTSGGSSALRYWPPTARAAVRDAGLDPGPLASFAGDFIGRPDWQLFNLSIDQIIALRRVAVHPHHRATGP